MTLPWDLACPACLATSSAEGLPTVCACGSPWLVHYASAPPLARRAAVAQGPPSLWRYRDWLPILPDETPTTLGEGMTPLVEVPRLASRLGLARVWIKDEAQNPTGSFKSRGMSAAVTRAVAGGARAFAVPTAGNAGVALAAYGARAGVPVRVFAPAGTPSRLLEQMRVHGAHVEVVDGHIGDCGKVSRAWATAHGALDVSTLREPYRIEGKKTMGLEIAEQFGWSGLPDAIVYPTGGGTGLIGMWKAFEELRQSGWLPEHTRTRLFSVQSTGCAPVVRAWEAGAEMTTPWDDPVTVASGLRVPGPLGGRLILRALRETDGAAIAVTDARLTETQHDVSTSEGLDLAPEGGAALAALGTLRKNGTLAPECTAVVFNTGAGWLYR